MDWSKAKNLLIFLFLALNIFLLINIINMLREGAVLK
jgi:regulatory protein YycI of two-component signal transduction system YycFG